MTPIINVTLTAKEIGLLILIGGLMGGLITGIATGKFDMADMQNIIGFGLGALSTLGSGILVTRNRIV